MPLLPDDELQRLADDIKANGLHHPIVLYQGAVIDGRNRLLACERIGVKPATVDWTGTLDEAADLVWSLNAVRRMLPKDRQAAIYEGLKERLHSLQATAEAERAAARERQREGGREAGKGRPKQVVPLLAQPIAPADRKSRTAEARRAGVGHTTLQKIRALPVEERKAVAAGEKTLGDIERAQRLRERDERNRSIAAGNRELPADARRYAVIYSDPPWKYEHAISTSREIEEKYPTLDIDAICSLPVGKLAAEDCVLFLWCPAPLIKHGLRVLEAWGFEYRTMMIWDKQKIGMGFWVRQNAELLLLGVHGKPSPPEPPARPVSVISIARKEHSQKPVEFYSIIERMIPNAARLEMFARARREGWDSWGNQS